MRLLKYFAIVAFAYGLVLGPAGEREFCWHAIGGLVLGPLLHCIVMARLTPTQNVRFFSSVGYIDGLMGFIYALDGCPKDPGVVTY